MLTFTPPTKPWSINEDRSLHWAQQSKRTKAWRQVAFLTATVATELRDFGPASVTVELPFARNARRDPMNYIPAVKALVDGLVDAGVWPDDTADWVTVIQPMLCVGADDVRVLLAPR